MPLQAQSLIGLIAFPLLAWLMSERREALSSLRLIRIVGAGLALQLGVAALMLNVPALRGGFDWAASLLGALQEATATGMRLVFGYLAGSPAPYATTAPENSFILAFQALPLVLLVSALSKLLYHWGILQRVVAAFAFVLERTMGVSGPVGTSAAANVFVGMIEAPLLVKPYLAGMSRGGLFATMTVGMAGVAGTVLALYAAILGPGVPGVAGHLIVASVISVPAALLLSALMVPDDDTMGEEAAPVTLADPPRSTMDAVAQGTREGVGLLVNVTAMLVVMIALVALANMALGWVTAPFGPRLTFEGLLGYAFAPLAWLTGIPWEHCRTAGALLGVKTVLNELIAYLQLAGTAPELLTDRSRLIMTYALCGFANLGSLGIMLGGLSAMVPERRGEIVELGGRTLVAGTLATLMTAAAIGLLTPG